MQNHAAKVCEGRKEEVINRERRLHIWEQNKSERETTQNKIYLQKVSGEKPCWMNDSRKWRDNVRIWGVREEIPTLRGYFFFSSFFLAAAITVSCTRPEFKF